MLNSSLTLHGIEIKIWQGRIMSESRGSHAKDGKIHCTSKLAGW